MRQVIPAFLLLGMFLTGTLVADDPAKVTIQLAGHVKKMGDYSVDKRVRQNLDELIKMAGGFSPLTGFEHETTSSVAWIQRSTPDVMDQLVIIDYQSKQILSQRRMEDGKWRLERYDWDTFEYQPGDCVFVTTSRKSLDLVGYPIKYVQDGGWKNFEKLRYFGKTFEETQAIDAAKDK